ncbi:MAG: S1 RNA-binding domain-containing protein [Polyangiaceae bacterium]|nr:S1 RNA-binding domain-containing protein [Polyangiaceae bacterium]
MPQGPANSKESFASLFEQTEGAGKRRRRWQTGESVEVTIVAVGREAVFADLGGKQEGVFERIDLAGEDGTLRVEVGSRVSAVVASIDPETGQARLKPVVVRAPTDDAAASPPPTPGAGPAVATPAGAAGPLLVEGAHIKGKVTGIERYGVFVQIAGTHGRSGRGLVPTAETATPRGADLKKHFAVGQDVEAKILSVDETGKIRLSISALKSDAERGEFEAYAKGGEKKGKPEVRSFGTLGDLLAKKAKR